MLLYLRFASLSFNVVSLVDPFFYLKSTFSFAILGSYSFDFGVKIGLSLRDNYDLFLKSYFTSKD